MADPMFPRPSTLPLLHSPPSPGDPKQWASNENTAPNAGEEECAAEGKRRFSSGDAQQGTGTGMGAQLMQRTLSSCTKDKSSTDPDDTRKIPRAALIAARTP